MHKFSGDDFILLGMSVLALLIGLLMFFKTYKATKTVGQATFVYGASGFDSSSIVLQCPPEKNITVQTAWVGDNRLGNTSSGASPNGVYGNGVCDPFKPDGTLNSSNTSSVVSMLQNQCGGQNKCTFTIPAKAPFGATSQCGGKGNSMMVATYSCN
jgi:hypothetical protein